MSAKCIWEYLEDDLFDFRPGDCRIFVWLFASVLVALYGLFSSRSVSKNAQGNIMAIYCFHRLQTEYDSIHRSKLWTFLHKCQMSHHINFILKDLNHADKHMLLDGDKRASVQPSFGVVIQGCPVLPLLLIVYLKDVDGAAHILSLLKTCPHCQRPDICKPC